MVTLEKVLINKDLILREKLYKIIKKAGKWLHQEKGLNLRVIINDLLIYKYGYHLPKSEIIKFKKDVKILYKTNLHHLYIDETLKKLKGGKIENEKYLVDENGNWDPLNKMDTNINELSYFLSDILIHLKNDKNHPFNINIKSMIKKLLLTDNPRPILRCLEKELVNIINYYYKSLDDFLKYKFITIENSKDGNKVEDKTEKKFLNNGKQIKYRGGNGDRIDMLFSIDLIYCDKNDDNYITVQVKKHKQDLDIENYYFNIKHVDKITWEEPNGEIYQKRNPKSNF